MTTNFRVTPPAPKPPRPYHFPEVTRLTLENGLRILVAQNRNAPVVSVRALIRSGADRDPSALVGLASMTAEMLDEGTTSRNAIEIAEAVADLGAALVTGSDWDASYVSLDILSRNLAAGLDVFADVLLHPVFPEADLERVRDERMTSILQQRDEPGAVAAIRFAHLLYEGTPYGNPLNGTEKSIASIDRQAIEAFYRTHYIPNQTSLIITGDIDAAMTLDLAKACFYDWNRGLDVPPLTLTPKEAGQAMVYLIDRPAAVQSELRVGHVGVARRTDDYFPLIVTNALLGGVFSSRLNLSLREKHGYTYGIRSSFGFRQHAGPFSVSTAVRNEVTMEAVREIINEIRSIRTGEVTEAELNDTKNYLMGVFPAMVQDASGLASRVQELELYSLPSDYFDSYRERIADVGADDLARVARKHLDPDRLTIVVVGKAEEIHKPLTALGYDVGLFDIDGNPL